MLTLNGEGPQGSMRTTFVMTPLLEITAVPRVFVKRREDNFEVIVAVRENTPAEKVASPQQRNAKK